jgi:hypothetical protein
MWQLSHVRSKRQAVGSIPLKKMKVHWKIKVILDLYVCVCVCEWVSEWVFNVFGQRRFEQSTVLFRVRAGAEEMVDHKAYDKI